MGDSQSLEAVAETGLRKHPVDDGTVRDDLERQELPEKSGLPSNSGVSNLVNLVLTEDPIRCA